MRVFLSPLALLVFAGGAGAAVSNDGMGTRVDEASVLEVADDSQSFVTLYDQSHLGVLRGGSVAFIQSFDSSSISLYEGGRSASIDGFGRSTLEILGGEVSHLNMSDGSGVQVHGGTVSHLSMSDESSIQVHDGAISHLGIFGHSTAAIYRADIGFLLLSDTASVDLYGYDFSFRNGHLSGRWSNGTVFTFWLMSAESGAHGGDIFQALPGNLTLQLVPLPASGWLLACGAILLLLTGRTTPGASFQAPGAMRRFVSSMSAC